MLLIVSAICTAIDSGEEGSGRRSQTHASTQFVLHQDTRTARCTLQTHSLGLELRLAVDGALLQSHVCGSQDDVLTTSEQWAATMREKGWR
jgi:hypothetical protein